MRRPQTVELICVGVEVVGRVSSVGASVVDSWCVMLCVLFAACGVGANVSVSRCVRVCVVSVVVMVVDSGDGTVGVMATRELAWCVVVALTTVGVVVVCGLCGGVGECGGGGDSVGVIMTVMV